MSFISKPFGALMLWLYNVVDNYGIAIIIFAALVKLILLPLTMKQQSSMQKMQMLQPKLQQLQVKYQNDKEKLSAETMKLYQETGINPMSGCLPLLIQFPIIIALYQVIYRPLTYMFGLTAEQISSLVALVNENLTAAGSAILEGNYIQEITIAQNFTEEIIAKSGITNLQLMNFDFLWINLGLTPSFARVDILWVIPVLAGLSTFLSTKVATSMNKTADSANNQTADTMKMMNNFFPLMTAWIAFSLPAGVGLYWIVNNVLQIIQQVVLNKYYQKKNASDPLIIEALNKPEEEKKKKKKK